MSTAQGGSAWQAGGAAGEAVGSWPGGGRVAGVETTVVEQEEAAFLKVLSGARNEA